jgi:hypothetical protein
LAVVHGGADGFGTDAARVENNRAVFASIERGVALRDLRHRRAGGDQHGGLAAGAHEVGLGGQGGGGLRDGGNCRLPIADCRLREGGTVGFLGFVGFHLGFVL